MKLPLRFTTRDLLWLTVVLALAIGWCIDHNRRLIALGRYQVLEIHGNFIVDTREGKVWVRDGDIWVRSPEHEEKAR